MYRITNKCQLQRLLWIKKDANWPSYEAWIFGPGESLVVANLISLVSYNDDGLLIFLWDDSLSRLKSNWVEDATWAEIEYEWDAT